MEKSLQDKLEAMARFMPRSGVFFIDPTNGITLCAVGDLQYHTSYDWLHRVWEKFRDLTAIDSAIGINLMECIEHRDRIRNALTDGTISEAFEALYQGIEFVNGLKR